MAGMPLYGTRQRWLPPAAKAAGQHDGRAHTSPFQLNVSLAEVLLHQVQPARSDGAGLDGFKGPRWAGQCTALRIY